MLNKKYLLFWLLPLLLVLVYLNVNWSSKNESNISIVDDFIVVSTWSLSETIQVVWNTELVDEQSLWFNISWTVTSVNFKEWESVKKWETIAEIDNSDAYSSIEEAKINLENAKISLSDLYDWPDESSIMQSKKNITDAENALLNAQKEYDNLLVTQSISEEKMLSDIESLKKEIINLENNLSISKDELENSIKEKNNNYQDTLSDNNKKISDIEDSLKVLLLEANDIIEKSDYIMWVTNKNKSINDSYDIYLWAKDSSLKNKARNELLFSISLYNEISIKLDWYSYESNIEELTGLLNEFLGLFNSLSQTTEYFYNTVDASVESWDVLTESDINSMKSSIWWYRTSSLNKISSINWYLNTLNTLTDLELLTKSNNSSILSINESIKSQELSIEKQYISLSNSEKEYEQTLVSNKLELEEKLQDIESKKFSLQIANENYKELLEWPTQSNITKANNSIRQAEIKLNDAYESLEDYKITAPFDWIIRKIDYMVWDKINNDTDKYIYIENPNLIEISVYLDQIDIVDVEIWDEAIITFDAYLENPIRWIISSIDTTPISNSWVISYEVKLVMTEEFNKKIFSWFTADVEIITLEKNNILLIKSSSINNEKDKSYVYIDKNWIKEKIYIETWLSSNWNTEVISWLNIWDKIYSSNFSITWTSENKNNNSLLPTWPSWNRWNKSIMN